MSTKAYPIVQAAKIDAVGSVRIYDGTEMADLFEKYSEEYDHPSHFITIQNVRKMKRVVLIKDSLATINYWLKLMKDLKLDQLEFEIG